VADKLMVLLHSLIKQMKPNKQHAQIGYFNIVFPQTPINFTSFKITAKNISMTKSIAAVN